MPVQAPAAFLDAGADKQAWMVLAQVASAANSSQDLDSLCSCSLDALGSLFSFQSGLAFVLERDLCRAVIVSACGAPEIVALRGLTLDVAPGLADDPSSENLQSITRALDGLIDRALLDAPTFIPLCAEQRMVGLLALLGCAGAPEQEQTRREQYQPLLAAVGVLVSLALERMRHDARQRPSEELRALAHVGELIAQAVPPDVALHAVAVEIARVLPADYVSFHLREESGLRLVAESEPTGAPPVLPILPYQYRILDELETTRIRDSAREAVSPEQQEHLRRYNLVADLGVPLVATKKAIGILYISRRQPHAWTESEVQLARTFAQLIAGALTHARLLSELQTQVRDLRALARSAGLIALSRAPETALPQIAGELRASLKCDYVGFHLLEGDYFRVVTEPRFEWAQLKYPMRPDHVLLLQHLQKAIVHDRERDSKSEDQRSALAHYGIGADLGIPMVARGRPLGVLYASYFHPHKWEPGEIQLVETYAQHIATVLDNVLLLQEQQAQVRELELLAELNEIAVTIPDEDALTELALTAARNLLGADETMLLLCDGASFRPVQSFRGRVYPQQPPPLSPVLQHLMDTGEPLVVDLNHPPRLDEELARRHAFYQFKASLVVRLTTAHERIGLLSFDFEREHAFTDSEVRLAQAAANELAMAFANSRLIRELRQRIARLNQLADFSQFCAAVHESAELQRRAAERIRTMLDAKAVSIRLIQGNELTVGASAGYQYPELRDHPMPVPPQFRDLLANKQSYSICNFDEAADLSPEWRDRHLKEGMRAMIMLPMIAEHEATGILSVFYAAPRSWCADEIQYAQTIANTLGLALANVRATELARRHRDELQATLDSVFSGVFTTDLDGVILSWNRAAAQITGFSAQEMIGKNWHTAGTRVGTARTGDMLIDEAMADREVRFSVAPRYFPHREGHEIQLRQAAAPLRDRSGNVSGAVCAFWDRTHEQEAERARIDFINEVGHQFGNKLGAVIMSAQQLQRSRLSASLRAKYIQIIGETIGDLEHLHQRFLAFQRGYAREQVQDEDINLQAVVKQLLERYRAAQTGRRFVARGTFDHVQADRHRLMVVLENLLDNAIKYSPPRGTITLRAALPNPDELTLAIHNRGDPIPADLKARLFNRWQRGASGKPGTGLGLWLAQAKLLEMGGTIRVESSARQGTTFTVTLRRTAHGLAASNGENEDKTIA